MDSEQGAVLKASQTAAALPAASWPAADANGLERLYVEHVVAARRFAFVLVGDVYLAEELVQEAFVRIVGRLRHLRDRGAFEQYLRTAIANLARSHFRRRRLERAQTERREVAANDQVDGPDLAEHDALFRALLRLPPRQRAAIALRYLEDRSEGQIASMLDCRPGTVRSLLSRGIAQLRNLVQEIDHE